MSLYFDHNGTTPVDARVYAAMVPYLTEHFGNPSSSHAYGREPRRALAEARSRVAESLACEPDEIVFTSGASESNSWVIQALARTRGGHILTTRIEHPSIQNACRSVHEQGLAEVEFLEVDDRARVTADQVAAHLRPNTSLISVMLANNEVGTVQPLQAIAALGRERGVLVHTDAAQAVGKLPVSASSLGVDLLSLAGHKCYAPKGVGALYVRRGVELAPLIFGAGHESGRRSGTESVPLIVGLGVACRLVRESMPAERDRLAGLRDQLQRSLAERLAGSVVVNAGDVERLPNTLSLNFLGVTGAEVLAGCRELAASTGPACHDGQVRLSHVLAAMGVPLNVGKGAVRLSLGRSTTAADVERAADELVASYQALRPTPVEGGLGLA